MTANSNILLAQARQLRLAAAELERQAQGKGVSAIEPQDAASTIDLRHRAKAILKSRDSRERFFDADLFGEPAYDMLLDLFMSAEDKKAVSVSSACVAARVPQTTALRWISLLEKRGLVERAPDIQDGRRQLLRLTSVATESVRAFLSQTAARA
jgi:DNA-binding transcriptional ArsR family regulator